MTHDSSEWRLAYLAREANRNVFGHGSRMWLLLLIAIMAGVAQAAFGALESQAFVDDLERLEAKGRNVVVFESSDPAVAAAIERRSCEGLRDGKSVIQAGMLVPGAQPPVVPLGAAVRTVAASTSLVRELQSSPILIGASLAAGSRSEANVTVWGVTLTATALPRQPEGIDVNSSVVVALDPSVRHAPVCIVRFARYVDAAASMPYAQSRLVSAGPPLAAAEVLRNPSDPVDRYAHRPTRALPILLGVCGGVFMAIILRLRVGQIAAYYLSGSSRIAVATILTLEALLVGATSALAGFAAVSVLFPHFIDPGAAAAMAVASGLMWPLGAGFVIAFLATRNPMELAKDR